MFNAGFDAEKWARENIDDPRVANSFLRLCEDTFVMGDTIADVVYLQFGGEHNFSIEYIYNDGIDKYEPVEDNIVFLIEEDLL